MTEPPGPIFLTGGTGLVGSHAAERLRQAGVDVVALHRPDSRVEHLRELGCSLVEGDVRQDEEDLAQSVEGCRGVVHSAAAVYRNMSWPRLRALNVEAAGRVARAASLAGAGRFVHISSVAVYGPTRGPVDEDSPPDSPLPPGALYARSKREAEDAVRAVAEEEGLELTILRPSVVYGERDRLFSPRLRTLLRLPIVPVAGNGRLPLPVVYAGNVAEAVVLSLAGPVEEGRVPVYNVAGDHALDFRALMEGLARGMGRRRPRFLPLPPRFLTTLARLGEGAVRALPGRRPVPPLRRGVELAIRGNPYRSDRVRTELGWSPPVGGEEALERTGRWLAEDERTG